MRTVGNRSGPGGVGRGVKRILSLIGGALALLTALVGLVGLPSSPASAGGWVVVSLDERPEFHAGEPTEVGFTVLRHGVTPESSDDMAIVVTGDGVRERFAVVPDGEDGHHVATITLGEGTYTWELQGTFMPYEFGTLDVGGSPASAASWGWDVAQWGGVGTAAVLGGLAGVQLLRRRRAVPAAA